MIDLRDHIRLSRPASTPTADNEEAWARWEARLDGERGRAIGPPDPAHIALAVQCAAQERILFGHVRTRFR